MKFLVIVIAALFLLSGCLEPDRPYSDYPGPGEYDDPNTDYYDTGIAGENPGECGYSNGSCCQWMGTDEFGMFTARYYCNDGLECRAETCVEGPEYESYTRPEYP